MLDLEKLGTLKQMLVEATDFSDVYGYFMDHFGEDPELMAMGERFRDPAFLQMLERLGAQVVGKKARIEQPLFLRVKEHRFVHGAFRYGDHVGCVFYFGDIEKGLAAFGSLESEGPTELARFTMAQVAKGKGRTLH
jgi:hypothetical protein